MFDATAAIADIAARYFPPNPVNDIAGWTTEPIEEWGGPLDDETLLTSMLKSGKNNPAYWFADKVVFEDLFHANAEKLAKYRPGTTNGYDASAIDWALAIHFAYWTGKNNERTKEFMLQSALVRHKWERRPEYLETTIMKAAAVVDKVAQGWDGEKFRIDPAIPTGDWNDPDLGLLEGPDVAAPDFPRHVLGEDWARIVAEIAEGGNAPFDYVATALLVIAAALIGNAREAAASTNFRQALVLWGMLVGGPSAGKSPALALFVSIIAQIQQDLAVDFARIEQEYQSQVEIAKAREAMWKETVKACIKDGGPPPPMPADCQLPEPPTRPRIFISDTTMEAAGEIVAGNPKGLVMFREEIAGWWKGFNRYGGDGERKFWLEGYDGRPYTIDRKKNPKPVIIPRLATSVMGGAQPDALNEMLASEQDGFAARFLYAYPEPVTGFQLKHDPVDLASVETAFRRLYSLTLVDDGSSPPKPYTCFLTPQAAAHFETWWRERRHEAMAALGLWGQWLGKQGGMALRFALVIEHLWWSSPADSVISAESAPQEISETAIAAATDLIDTWSAPMARRVFGAAAVSPNERNAAVLARWLRQQKLATFNARSARREGRGCPITDAAAMSTACEVLMKAGIIRYLGGREGGAKGRQRLDYEVNPLLVGR